MRQCLPVAGGMALFSQSHRLYFRNTCPARFCVCVSIPASRPRRDRSFCGRHALLPILVRRRERPVPVVTSDHINPFTSPLRRPPCVPFSPLAAVQRLALGQFQRPSSSVPLVLLSSARGHTSSNSSFSQPKSPSTRRRRGPVPSSFPPSAPTLTSSSRLSRHLRLPGFRCPPPLPAGPQSLVLHSAFLRVLDHTE